MSDWDFTCRGLVGATVRAASREGQWLRLVTDKGEWHVAGGRVRMDLECPKCREHRLVEIVTDPRGDQGVCAVCAHAWWVRKREIHSDGC